MTTPPFRLPQEMTEAEDAQHRLSAAIAMTPYSLATWRDAFTTFVTSGQHPDKLHSFLPRALLESPPKDRHIALIKQLTTDLNRARQSINGLRRYTRQLGRTITNQRAELARLQPTPEQEPTMTTEFTASNGIEVRISPSGRLTPHISGKIYTAAEEVRALREFFQHERDEELGRWRDPEAPHYVVYPTGEEGLIRVLDEEDGNTWLRDEEDSDHHHRLTPNGVAARYFAAHPEPKPWHDAKPGEVWVIKLQGDAEGQPVGVFDFDGVPHFSVPGAEDFSTRYRRIESGYRIWPEETDDE